MDGKTQYKVLAQAYSRSHLLDQGKKNGVDWDEDTKNEGINWLRFSIGLIKFLDAGNDFHTDNADEASLQAMLKNYQDIMELHKKTMVPHLRAAMSKLQADKGTADSRPMEMLQEAYKHLDQYGGSAWADKVSTLSNLNSRVKNLSARLGKPGKADNMPTDTDGGDHTKVSNT
jgi:hypothetical protein